MRTLAGQHTGHAVKARAWQSAAGKLTTAAESGASNDIEAATKHVERALLLSERLRHDERPPESRKCVPADRMMHNIYQEIEDRWRSAYADMHCEVSPRDDFHRMLSERGTLAHVKTTDGLQPQLGILEFGLEWLAYVHVALAQKDGMGPAHPDARAPWALTGSAVSFGLSIRSLCVNGFDTPARALLRTYVETLFLCLAFLYDRSLAEEYAAAATDADVKNFWHTSASPKNLHQRIITIEKSMEFDDAGVYPAWRRREYEILSQSSHLSFIAAALTSMSPQLGDPGKFSPGIFGLASHNSLRTLSYAAVSTWYFSEMCGPKLLGLRSSESLIVLDKENELHKKLYAGAEVLWKVTMDNWDRLGGERDG